jgi:hypothetical protein
MKKITLFSLLLTLSFISIYAQQNTAEKLNVLLIVADDLGMQVGALNTPGVQTLR